MNLVDYFLYIPGLYALLILIPFILLYLVKPKPKKVVIPSLMFLMKDQHKSNLNSFLRKFMQDFLFYLQFLILLFLALAVAKPFITVPSISYANSLVIVIDGSASMNAVEDGSSRFEKAKEIALDRLEGRNTIILATDTAQVVLEKENAGEAKDIINGLTARHTTSSLYDSVVLSENYLGRLDTAVLVISDFSTDKLEKEFFRAKAYLEAKGVDVFFEDVSENKARNIGIIDLDVQELETQIWVKNFNNNPESVTLQYGDTIKQLELAENDVQSVSIPTISGTSTVELKVLDDFELDNYAYISTPEESSLNVMFIGNEDEPYLTTVFELLSKITVDKNQPPIVTFKDPDVIVLGKVNKNVVIPGDISKIKQLVRDDGVPLIVLAQENILDLNLGDILPLEFQTRDPVSNTQVIKPYHDNTFLTPSEIQFGIARRYYDLSVSDGVTIHAQTQSGIPVITTSAYGSGKVLYYGLFDEYSEFKSDIFYPIFWKRSIDLLIGGKTLGEINKQTGFIVFIGKEQNIKTPVGNRRGKSISLDYSGFYTLPTYTVAANLLSEEEQRLNRDSISIDESKLSIEADKTKNDTKEKDISMWLIWLGLMLLIVEILFTKFRGDI